jgi:hypothetical protein
MAPKKKPPPTVGGFGLVAARVEARRARMNAASAYCLASGGLKATEGLRRATRDGLWCVCGSLQNVTYFPSTKRGWGFLTVTDFGRRRSSGRTVSRVPTLDKAVGEP